MDWLSDESPLQAMHMRERRFGLVLLVLGMVAVGSMVLSLLAGPFSLDAPTVFRALAGLLPAGPDTTTENAVVFTVVRDIRLSRTILALLIGSGLAVSGVVFQGLLRNPLADPFTLGVSSGGAFGASLAISLGIPFGRGFFGSLALPLAALAGAFAALGAVLLLGRRRGGFNAGLDREALVLGGVVVATFLSACISLFKALNEESVAAIVFWIMGSLQGRGWEHLQLFMPFYVAGMLIIACYSRELDLLSLGSDQARALGVNTSRARLRLLVGASMVTSAAVAVSGVIGFVGLVVPHLLRLLIGGEHRPLLAASAILGGILLLWADMAARTILSGGAELPVGVLTALIGGPFFCVLLARSNAR